MVDLQFRANALANVPGEFLAVSKDHRIHWQLELLKDPIIRNGRPTSSWVLRIVYRQVSLFLLMNEQ